MQVNNKQMIYNFLKSLIYNVTSLVMSLREGCMEKIQDGVRQKAVSQQSLFGQSGFIQRVIWKHHFSCPKTHPKDSSECAKHLPEQTLPKQTDTRNRLYNHLGCGTLSGKKFVQSLF